MSKLGLSDLRPFTRGAAKHLIGHINRATSSQGAAASVASPAGLVPSLDPVHQAGQIQDISFVSSAQPATGESLVLDVTVNGVSILSGTYTFNGTLEADTVYSLKGLLVNKQLNVGDIVRVIRTYTAGGSPALGSTTANSVRIEVAPESAA